MTAAVRERLSVWPRRIQTQPKSIMHGGKLRVAIETVIARPVAHHRRVSRAKTFMDFVVMPVGQFGRRQSFGITHTQKLNRPAAAVILNVGHEILRKQMRAGHLSQLKESTEQTRLASRKNKTITSGRIVSAPGNRQQIIPGRRRRVDQISAKVQQAHINIARKAVKQTIDAGKLKQ